MAKCLSKNKPISQTDRGRQGKATVRRCGHNKSIGVVYTRTSSPGLKVERSKARQIQSGAQAAKGKGGAPVVKKVCEVISGSLPLDRRNTLMDLLSGKVQGLGTVNPKKLKVFVESARAIERDAMVGADCGC